MDPARRPVRAPAAVAALAGALAACALLACASPPDPLRGLPGVRVASRVVDPVPRAGYLDARIEEADGSSLRFLFPDSPVCRRVLEAGAEVAYTSLGVLGRVQRGEDVCVPVGILSLARWRDSRPSPGVPPRPRAQASYRVVHADEEYVFARGRFPLAGLVGWAGATDTIAVVPNMERCRETLAGGVASMEYLEHGPEAFVLITPDGDCPIRGFALPAL